MGGGGGKRRAAANRKDKDFLNLGLPSEKSQHETPMECFFK